MLPTTLVTILSFLLKLSCSSPVYNMQPAYITATIGSTGRNIRNLPCISRKSNQSGVCMFAIDCLKANGTHLGTCIDRFYFGSCCHVEHVHDITENTIDTALIPSRQPPQRISSTTEKNTTSATTQPPSTTQKPVITTTARSTPNITTTERLATTVAQDVITKLTTMAKISQSTFSSTIFVTRRPITTAVKTTVRPAEAEETTIPYKLSTFQSVDSNDIATTLKPFPTTTPPRPSTKPVKPTLTTTSVKQPNPQTKPTSTYKPKPTTKPQIINITQRPTHRPITRTTTKTRLTRPSSTKPVKITKPSTKPVSVIKPTLKPSKNATKPVRITTATPKQNVTVLLTTTEKLIKKPTTFIPVDDSVTILPPRTTTVTKISSFIVTNTAERPTSTSPRPVLLTVQTLPVLTTTEKFVKIPKPTTATRPPTIPPKPVTLLLKPVTLPSKPVTLPSKPVTLPSKPTTLETKPTTQTTTPTTQILTPSTSKLTAATTTTTTTTTVVTTSTTQSNELPINLNVSSVLEAVNGNPATNEIEAEKPVKPLVPAVESTMLPGLVTWSQINDNATMSPSSSSEEAGEAGEDWVPITTPDGWVLLPSLSTVTEPSSDATTFSSVTNESAFSAEISQSQSPSTESIGSSSIETFISLSPSESAESGSVTPSISSSPPEGNLSSVEVTTAGSASTVQSGAANMSDFTDVCGRRMFPEARIVGGEKSSFGKWPWQISLRQWRTSTYLHKCGAALLNENWAITAAHCVDNVPPSDLLLRLGEHDLSTESEPYLHQERRVQIVASHPQFDPRTFEYDLALLRFYEPVQFQPNIIPVCVPQNDENFVGRTAYVTGWGRLYEDGPLPSILQEVSVPVINNTVCESMYRSAGYIEHIPNIFICAGWRRGGFDSCEGDSGGPMVIQRPDKRFLLAGVISWGIGCAEPNQPGVYTRISEFRDWINQILQF